jgi:hypothetical protein
MRPRIYGCLFGWLLTACTAAQGDPNATSGKSITKAAHPATGIVVLELFTSQGCSSCPPADRLISSLASAGNLGDRQVVPLSFHVDYWNDLGWADPFSSPHWSHRQREYAGALQESGVYTPQVVIDGRAHVVGSDRRGLEKAVAMAPAMESLQVTAAWSGQTLEVHSASTQVAGTELWVAVWQDGLSTKVEHGENQGKIMRNNHVVRRLTKLSTKGAASVVLDPAWRNLGGLLFAQRTSDRAIVAATELPRATPGT